MNKQELNQLRQQAHALKPVVMIGSHGLTDAVHHEIDCALESHELIKIKIQTNDRDLVKSLSNAICEKHQASLVQQIGHVVVVYRANPDY